MLTSDERMYVAQAVFKAISQEVKTNQDNMRGDFDARFRERYHETGAKSYDALLQGQKVGTVTVKPDEPKSKAEFRIVDFDALEDWYPQAEDMFLQFVIANLPEFAEFYFMRTGEMPGGCTVETVTPEPKEPTVTLRIDEKKVADVMHGLPGDVLPLLED